MKIHLGCGPRRLEGFVHVDPDETHRPDHVGDALNIPLPDGIANLLYFSHGLEHVRKRNVAHAVAEFRRVLRPGGTLRLSMPSFNVITTLYRARVSLARLGCINGGQDNEHDLHYAVYDFEHLACALHRDFYDIRHWNPVEVHPDGYDDFSLARINGQLISLNVEATCK